MISHELEMPINVFMTFPIKMNIYETVYLWKMLKQK